MAVCAAVAEVHNGSHPTLNALFEAAGAPGPPPDLPHATKWKTWIFRAGNDPKVDSLALLGNLLEEFMDLSPLPGNGALNDFLGGAIDRGAEYVQRRDRLTAVLEDHGYRYFKGGRVLPIDPPLEPGDTRVTARTSVEEAVTPSSVEDLLAIVIKGLPRAMHPLTYRRRGSSSLSFDSEYDIQDLLHSQLRPWISDIRPEEFTPSYAASSSRMDFLLPDHKMVLETKRVRNKQHARSIGDELIVDIEHYRRHSACDRLWCVVYDPSLFITNPKGLIADLEGRRATPDGVVDVRVFVLGAVAL